ncbi:MULTISPECIES: FixH family protein [Cupriavidus]|uniref:Transmembrane lipoprotein n=1 Tax=Cupriavidus taiwanensis TaxID=164546 RepID=A0A976AGL1_9BURK|nr:MULTISPECIES: FixH family protein [Cupriavidus]MEC3765711.1 FixH family protein [Cupriavidus sp. SS-3]SOY79740.1 putative transmembrane lipoprotein [Cupriavidus taiwanensis]SOY81710.1 putative transmembrane lipoprotein [Cupriavidus taiwanensis]SPA24999.1 putative transmembrane lipoprotein [Cupriavidus taiwanensis]SPD64953.1 conserved protein of unknown function [Cupriavidus taiwanensis]
MSQQGNPWWKEPWPWLLMAGPLVAMVACGVTIWLASAHPDLPVQGAARHGLVVEKVEAVAPKSAAARQP